ncbi:MAG: MBL fold metallo-hydrolase [Clostridia bacterium]|nr:MBL fold metallo-hydrolase [Clostridia bacterium]
MKLHFLGTGAADFNIHAHTTEPDFRRNASLLIDGCLLVDPGACLFEFETSFGYENLYGNVKDIVNTHRHSDHFNPDTLAKLTEAGAVFHPTAAGDIVETDKHIIRAFAANHCTAEVPVHFVIESKADGKRFFYGCDGAWLPYETYRALMKLGHLDLMIFDCTIGDIRGDYRIFEHNNAAMVAEMRASFTNICPRFMVSHLARTLHPGHEEASKILAGFGLETAYDNLITEI